MKALIKRLNDSRVETLDEAGRPFQFDLRIDDMDVLTINAALRSFVKSDDFRIGKSMMGWDEKSAESLRKRVAKLMNLDRK